jgi:hypothetical protein
MIPGALLGAALGIGISAWGGWLRDVFVMPFILGVTRAVGSVIGMKIAHVRRRKRPSLTYVNFPHLATHRFRANGTPCGLCCALVGSDNASFSVRGRLRKTALSIDLTGQTAIPVPSDWKGHFDDETIDVLPLVADVKRPYNAGWCTYVHEHAQAPELEVCCSGVNSKTPKAGAIWRQGNLLHFGFEQSPAEMNETGRSLLVNSIAYISRFTEDRPIIETPSPFAPQRIRMLDRDAIGRLAADKSRGLTEHLKYYLSVELYNELSDKSREELAEWFRENRPWICAGEKGKLTLDEEARLFGEGPASPAFLEKAIRALTATGDQADRARRLLERYAPDGLGGSGSRSEWNAWHVENRPYLFFSDTGGYRWYIDRLAKARKIPTEKLRGSARASRPAIAVN